MVTSDFNTDDADKLGSASPTVVSFDFNDQKPIATLDGGNHSSFVDNYATTRHPPVPGTVYFYEVRPIVEGVQASSMEKHSVVRIFSPPKNFVFVHRWIANKTMCNLMHSESRSNVDHRMQKHDQYLVCSYDGVGRTVDENYDIGHDLLVMQVEAGCPYTRRGCTGDDYEDGDCIGTGNPDNVITAQQGAIFYDRHSQYCYKNNSGASPGDSWALTDGTSDSIKHSVSNQKLPPLIGYTKANIESNHCDEIAKNLNTNTLGVVTINGTSVDTNSAGSNWSTVKEYFFSQVGSLQSSNLPSRLEQIAYSQWDTDIYTHEEIEILEQGLSLNATSRCNSSFASGIEDEFINGDSFSVTAPYTKTATENSLDGFNDRVRSLETGSSITQNCKSRYGVQDHVGNLSEISKSQFTFVSSTNYKLPYPDLTSDFYLSIGIPNDDDNISWAIDQESDGHVYFDLALGLPQYNAAVVTERTYVEINTSAGITAAQLHDDIVAFTDPFYNPTTPGPDPATNALILSGGSYKTGRGAGTWTLQLFNDETALTDITQPKDVGFRCVIPLKEENYFEAQFGKGTKNH
tara:strand:- start:1555 stop:3279 length:1725 start_codon:yes stop_codon:yes gene_type:complete